MLDGQHEPGLQGAQIPAPALQVSQALTKAILKHRIRSNSLSIE